MLASSAEYCTEQNKDFEVSKICNMRNGDIVGSDIKKGKKSLTGRKHVV